MIQVGDFEILLLNDGTVHVDAGGPFGLVPRALYRRYFEPDAENMIPMTLTCLLVRAHGRLIVVDTGLGDKLTDRMKANWNLIRGPGEGLIAALARHGVRPDAVDIVIDTHLHADHCAGNTIFNPDSGSLRPTFPNAAYYVQRREYIDAMNPNERTRSTYYAVNFEPLVQTGQMTLLDGETEILPGIWGRPSPGHTPGHQSIVFESGGQTAAFVSDLASYAVHFERLSWMTAYDVEPLITLESKRRWQTWALARNALLMFQHDPTIKAGYASQEGEKYTITPVITGHD